MQIRSWKDFCSGLVFIAVGTGFAWGATAYRLGDSASPGPGYFPLGLGVLLAVLGAVVLFGALTLEAPDRGRIEGLRWRPLLVLLGAVALFGFALPRLGLMLTMPLLIGLTSLSGDEFRWRDVLLNAAVQTAGAWAVFVWLLKLDLPLWPVFLAH